MKEECNLQGDYSTCVYVCVCVGGGVVRVQREKAGGRKIGSVLTLLPL